ncbi:MAG TPA: murein biosynthesis integral membrane protein MurJ [Ktedonobacter sp.]|nr:murein biosynthesis integral membrane protein MurJ [Ktedonobacter sp.]
MENAGQPEQPLPQQPQHESQGQGYYGWQYDQEHPEMDVELSPSLYPANSGSSEQDDTTIRRPLPTHYQNPIADMGSSLGYGQGMSHQYFDAPQPSQPIAHLRQERLQHLREDRMRRQQRRMGPDITTTIPWKRGSRQASPVQAIQRESSWGQGAPPSMYVNGQAPVQQASPVSPDVAPVMSSTVARPQQIETTGSASSIDDASSVQPAVQPAQDTGMLRRVAIQRASLILTGSFIASRVLGLLRNSMFLFLFGTSMISDAYLQAFLVPDFIFNIVAGGALSSAFIPVFTNYVVGKKDEKTAWHIASSALNLALAIMAFLALIVIIFAPQIVPLYNPGIHDPVELALIAKLTRIMLLQPIALGVGVIVTSVLNARQNFLLSATGTVLYNVGLIAGLVPGIWMAVHGQRNDSVAIVFATWGVVLGAILQVAIQIPGLVKVGMRYVPVFDWKHPGVIQIGRQMVPRIINAAMLYCSTFVDRSLIELLVVVVGTAGIDGLITQYYQAFQLVLLPLSIFGMSVSTAAFPTLAEHVARGRMDRVRDTILETLRSILFMAIPSSIGLMTLALPIVQVLLEHGHFSLMDAQKTVVPLIFFSIGLTGLASVEILTRSFYAMRDSKTPVIVSIAQFILKIALSLILINTAVWGVDWGTGSLAFSTSIAGTLEAVVLFWLLHQRIGDLRVRLTLLFIGRVLLAAGAMGIAVLFVRGALDFILALLAHNPSLLWLNTTLSPSLGILGTLVAVVKLAIEILVGLIVYIRVARLVGIEELGPVKRVLDRLKLSWI